MSEEQSIICIGCPMGCAVTLTTDDGKVASITGHKCKEGEKYVLDEYNNPVRTLTATVLTQNSSQRLLAVRTTAPILKTKLVPGMMALAEVRAKPPIKMGGVIISNLLDTGVDVVATGDLPF